MSMTQFIATIYETGLGMAILIGMTSFFLLICWLVEKFPWVFGITFFLGFSWFIGTCI